MAACDNAAAVSFVGADAAADAAASVGAFANPSRNQDSLKTTLDGFFLPSMGLISPGQKPCVESVLWFVELCTTNDSDSRAPKNDLLQYCHTGHSRS